MRRRLVSQDFPEEVVTTVMDGCLDSENISRVPTIIRINFSLMLGYHCHQQDGEQNLAKLLIVALLSNIGVKEIMRGKGSCQGTSYCQVQRIFLRIKSR